MKSDFFRKNIFTISNVVVFVLMFIVIVKPYYSKQSSTEESLDRLNIENTQLKLENEKLKTDNNQYTSKVSSLQSQNEGIKKEIATYQNKFVQLESGIKNELVDSLGIFSPEYTKKGDKIAGLTVSDVYRKDNSNGSKHFKIDFTGEFVVKGTIVPNMFGGGYSIVVKNNLENIPHTFQEFDGVNLSIKNNDVIREALCEKFEGLSNFNNIEIETVLKNYTYNYVPESEVQNSAEFVKLIP